MKNPVLESTAWRVKFVLLLFAISTVQAGCVKEITEKNLFFPKRFFVSRKQVAREPVSIGTKTGVNLKGWYFRAVSTKEKRPSLIFFCGNGETVNDVSPFLHWLSSSFEINVLAIDYRGYGFSEGTPGFLAIRSDVIQIYDYLVDQLTDDKFPVFLYGRSIGAVFAIATAVQRKVSGLILQAPPTSVNDVISAWNNRIPWPFRWFIWLRPSTELESGPQPVDEIPFVKAPLLVIHGTADKIIPHSFGEKMFKYAGSQSKKFCSLKGLGHNNVNLSIGKGFHCLKEMFGSKK